MAATWTTPTYTVLIEGGDLSGCRAMLTLGQDGMRDVTFDVTDTLTETEDGWEVSLTMTQLQSARFRAGKPIYFQSNVIDSNGYRAATDKKSDMLDDNLLERTLEWQI